MQKDLHADDSLDLRVEKAERDIQQILQNLERDTELYVDNVNVDTRNFSQLRTEIFMTIKVRA